MAAKYWVMRSWKPKVKLNLGCRSNIAGITSYISIFVWSRYSQVWRSYGRDLLVNLWPWPLTCDLEKFYLLRSSLGMHNLERLLRYSHLFTKYCPCNFLQEPTSPKHEYRGQRSGHPVTTSMVLSPWKILFFWHNLGLPSQIWCQLKVVVNILTFSKWLPFRARDKPFYRNDTGSWIYEQDSHDHFKHFEYSIDAIADILTAIRQFKFLVSFWDLMT